MANDNTHDRKLIVDLGCGENEKGFYTAKAKDNVVRIDGYIADKEFKRKHGIIEQDFVQRKLPFGTNTVDKFVLKNSIRPNLTGPKRIKQLLKNLSRPLKVGGTVYITDEPTMNSPKACNKLGMEDGYDFDEYKKALLPFINSNEHDLILTASKCTDHGIFKQAELILQKVPKEAKCNG